MSLQEKFDQAAQKFGAEKFLYDGMHPMVAGATLIADAWLELFEKKYFRQYGEFLMKREDLHIRDPFIYTENGIYYLLGTTGNDSWDRGSDLVYTFPAI